MNLTTVCRLSLGAILIVAGAMKALHPAQFFSDLLSFHVPLPEVFLRMTAGCLPWLEVFAGAGLLFDVWRETIRPVVCALCLIFVVMLGQAVWRGLDLNCGCFGSGDFGWFDRPGVALVRAVVLFAASLYLVALQPGTPTAAPAPERTGIPG
jgi:putative oxidoreductase